MLAFYPYYQDSPTRLQPTSFRLEIRPSLSLLQWRNITINFHISVYPSYKCEGGYSLTKPRGPTFPPSFFPFSLLVLYFWVNVFYFCIVTCANMLHNFWVWVRLIFYFTNDFWDCQSKCTHLHLGRISPIRTLAWKIWCIFWVPENLHHFVIYLWRKVKSEIYKKEKREGKYECKFFPGEFPNGRDEQSFILHGSNLVALIWFICTFNGSSYIVWASPWGVDKMMYVWKKWWTSCQHGPSNSKVKRPKCK